MWASVVFDDRKVGAGNSEAFPEDWNRDFHRFYGSTGLARQGGREDAPVTECDIPYCEFFTNKISVLLPPLCYPHP